MEVDKVTSLPADEFLHVLTRLKRQYYAGNPIVSDAKYDKMEAEFRQQHPELVDQLPVGTVLDEFEKVEHPVPMGSLPKISSQSQVENWVAERTGEVVYQPKFDGCAVEMIYEDGELQHLLTRGDGDQGEDVTHVGRHLECVPSYLPDLDGTMILRGEAVLHKHDHPDEARRNLATGSLKSLDPKVAVERNLKIYLHTITRADPFEGLDYRAKFSAFEAAGFLVTPVFDTLENYDEPWFDPKYDVDGIVVKTLEDGEEDDAVAYKFPEETAYTEVTGISYELGRTRKISPVLHVDPVMIDNRELENVSLGSYEILENANIGVGDTVEVTFANDVIPHMESVVERTESDRFGLDECPECGGEVEMDGSHIYCQNSDSLSYRKQRFSSMLGGFDIDGLGKTGKMDLGELYDWDLTALVDDFMSSPEAPTKVQNLSGWGTKTCQSVHSQLVTKVESLSYKELFEILSLDAFGEKTQEKYLRENDDPYPITEERLLNTPMVKSRTAEKVLESFEERREFADGILKHHAGTPELGIVEEGSGSLEEVEVFVTGALDVGTRSDFKEIIKRNGGEYGKNQDDAILVTNTPNSGSSKLQYARENDLEILSEDEFFDRFGLDP
jgi:DNA ligase (NAD+)